eukprot:g317.t1
MALSWHIGVLLSVLACACAKNIGLHSGHNLETVHKRLDSNNDGQLVQEEITEALRRAYVKERKDKAAKLAREKAGLLTSEMEKLDTNSDGKLSREEAGAGEGGDADAIARWVLADADENNELSAEEAQVFIVPGLSVGTDYKNKGLDQEKGHPRSVYLATGAFDKLDADKDGSISHGEFAEHAREVVTGHAADDLDAVFLDDKDPKHEEILTQYLKVWFTKADANNDNKLTSDELPNALDFFEEEPDFEGEAESAVRLADTDSDSKISAEELAKAPVHVKDFMAAHSVHADEL